MTSTPFYGAEVASGSGPLEAFPINRGITDGRARELAVPAMPVSVLVLMPA